MFLVNGFSAKLIQHNRNGVSLAYDDEDIQKVDIKVICYDMDNGLNFGTYTVPEATGSFKLRRDLDVKEGDEIEFEGKTYSIIKVAEKWIFNRIEYKVAFVK